MTGDEGSGIITSVAAVCCCFLPSVVSTVYYRQLWVHRGNNRRRLSEMKTLEIDDTWAMIRTVLYLRSTYVIYYIASWDLLQSHEF